MQGWKLIPDHGGYTKMTLSQLWQESTVGREDCGIGVPNEHRHVSETHAVVKVVVRAYELCHTRHVCTAQAAWA
jgi:hypothetical protein